MTPTEHSEVGIVSTEVADSSSKTATNSRDASEWMVSDMLSQMEEDFRKSGDKIMNRMREVGLKMDALEQNIFGLVQDAGLDEEEDQSSENFNDSKGSTVQASPQKPSSASV